MLISAKLYGFCGEIIGDNKERTTKINKINRERNAILFSKKSNHNFLYDPKDYILPVYQIPFKI